ncbi:MAG: GNAT family N-acetyltransferase [Desulfovibrio sp.]|nr:GNAT family N-acetyltransferase [Desulfovibrio sp.]
MTEMKSGLSGKAGEVAVLSIPESRGIGRAFGIREIRPKDNSAVEQLIRTCLIEFGANHAGTAWTDPDLRRFSEVYATEGNKYWVGVDSNDAVIGGAGIGSLDAAHGVCELQKMYCAQSARGTGLAQALLTVALNYATVHYSICYLETLRTMIAAQKFYEKNGFIRTSEPLMPTAHFACDVRYVKKLR